MGPDWTVVIDDVLCMRYRHCMLCARDADRIDLCWLQDGSFAMAMALCAGCVKADVGETRRNALVAAHAQRGRAG